MSLTFCDVFIKNLGWLTFIFSQIISMSTDLRCYCFVQMLPILINKHLQLAILARNALSTRKDLPASCIFY